MTRRVLVVLILLCGALGAQAEALRVLFVGNSYTYVHGVPEILRQMAAAKGHELEYEQQTPPGRTFQHHWEAGQAVRKMQAGDFDVVVFQNQSFEPVIEPDTMMKYGQRLAAAAGQAGAKKCYYLTPAYKEPVGWMKQDTDDARRGAERFPEMYDRLVEAYSELARATGGNVAPVGLAWKLAYESMPELPLHAPDHSHAAPTGAYLTALVFYATLFEEPPAGLPATLTIKGWKKDKTTEIKLDSKTHQALEAAAWQACRKFSL